MTNLLWTPPVLATTSGAGYSLLDHKSSLDLQAPSGGILVLSEEGALFADAVGQGEEGCQDNVFELVDFCTG